MRQHEHREYVTPDGQTLISGSYDRTLKIWDVRPGTLLPTIQEDSSVMATGFSADGKTILSGQSNGTLTQWVWDFDRLMDMSCDWIQDYLVSHPQQEDLCDGYLPTTAP